MAAQEFARIVTRLGALRSAGAALCNAKRADWPPNEGTLAGDLL